MDEESVEKNEPWADVVPGTSFGPELLYMTSSYEVDASRPKPAMTYPLNTPPDIVGTVVIPPELVDVPGVETTTIAVSVSVTGSAIEIGCHEYVIDML
jgi:hypothetical protein